MSVVSNWKRGSRISPKVPFPDPTSLDTPQILDNVMRLLEENNRRLERIATILETLIATMTHAREVPSFLRNPGDF